MGKSIRYFKCPGCSEITSFDLSLIAKPKSNFLICNGCKKKFYATITSSCCNLSLLFVSSNGNKKLTSIQTFKK